MSWNVLLFPAPLGPTKAVVSPALICMLRSFKIWTKIKDTRDEFCKQKKQKKKSNSRKVGTYLYFGPRWIEEIDVVELDVTFHGV